MTQDCHTKLSSSANVEQDGILFHDQFALFQGVSAAEMTDSLDWKFEESTNEGANIERPGLSVKSANRTDRH